jgi:hypothetical protein
MNTKVKTMFASTVVSCSLFIFSSALASGYQTFHVTITNLTHMINLTPVLVASHRKPVSIFDLGSPASDDLTAIAEGGNIAPLAVTLNENRQVIDVKDSGGLLGPGESVTVIVKAGHGAKRISLAAMMLPTNDGFIALDSVKVPQHGSATYFSPGFDAGTETNDEWCVNIPGPFCGGAGPSTGPDPVDEGYVHIHRGTQGIRDLAADVYDWRNPVAKITVKRVNNY